jgi:thioredoxin-related protein
MDKPMLVYGWAIWCKFCETLHKEVYPDPKISTTLKDDFVLVAVDLDSNKADARKFGISYPPKLVFIAPNEEEITVIPGYVPADTLYPILEQIKTFHKLSMVVPEDLPRTEDRGET